MILEFAGRFAVMACVLIVALLCTLLAAGLAIYGMLFVSGLFNRLFYYHSATELLLVACAQMIFNKYFCTNFAEHFCALN